MKEYALANSFVESDSMPGKKPDKYYSVEIPIIGLGSVYQFKIWEIESMFMSILVKENSGILPWIKTVSRLNMKYYSTDLADPYQYLDTEVRDVTRQEYGRLKGHYLVGLEVLESKGRDKINWSYLSREAQILPFNNLFKNSRRA
jgi:hypothetical protein